MLRFYAIGVVLSAVAFGQENGEMKLGKVELNGAAGVNFSIIQDRSPFPIVGPSFGAEVAVGLDQRLAATAGYMYDSTGTGSRGIASVSANASTFMGGLRAAIFTSPRIESFLSFSLGELRVADSVSVNLFGSGINAGASAYSFAMSPGVGMRYKISPRFGVSCDGRAIYAPQYGWYFRSTAGFYVRLGRR